MNENASTSLFPDSVGYLLSQCARLFRERISSALKPLGLTLYEYVSLRLISLNTPLSQGNLGEKYGIDRTTMVSVIDNLEDRGLVSREKSQSDRRSYRLLLTVKGRKVLTRARRIATAEQQKFLEPLSESEWDVVRNCLGRLIDAYNQ